MKQMIVKKQNDSVRESNKTKKFDKIWKTLLLAASLSLLSVMPVFARGWCRGLSKNAWWYDLGMEIIINQPGSGWMETVTELQNAIALTTTVGWLKIRLLQTAIP